jgi:hypothetical protein
MVTTTAQPDLDAYNELIMMDTAQLVSSLRDLLGTKLVAYLGKVNETRAVRQWANGDRQIGKPDVVERLRVAYRAARMITIHRDRKEVAQAWFQGLNPFLDDWSPARLLRDGDVKTDGPRVLGAARQFIAVG